MNQNNVAKSVDYNNVYNEVQNLKEYFIHKWWYTSNDFPKLHNKTSYSYKKRKEKEFNIFINDFINLIKQYPKDENNRKIWKVNANNLIDNFIINSDLTCMEDKNLLLNTDLLQISEDFVARAKSFDSSIDIEDIGQAMRNVWIINIIQLLLNKKIALTPSAFGYSMLYPYTDNYLDDKNISKEEKLIISDRFKKRLEGFNIEPESEYERMIFQLVGIIESEYHRKTYPMVFESLLSMHNAQMKSLKQQGEKTGPYEQDILGISIEKGGISVLADAYLVNGRLTYKEASFFFGYGVLLQICDDLQDAENDYKNVHMTIVSQLVEKWPLDKITNKLINFTFDIIDNELCLNCTNKYQIKELIRKNCLQLILFAVAKNKRLYTKRYFKTINDYFPFTQRYMLSIYKKLTKKLTQLEDSYNGTKTEKIIMNALLKNDS